MGPDAHVEGTFVERKERCNAETLARQISAFANGQPPGGLLVVGVTSKGEIVGVGTDKGSLEKAIGATNSLVDSIGWKYRWVIWDSREVLLCYVPFSSDRVICLAGGRAFQRKGESTIELTPNQIVELRYARGERSFEIEPAAPFAEDLLDSQQQKAFLDGVTRRNGLVLPITTRDALANKGLIDSRTDALTYAGLIALGRAPADLLSGARLRFLKFEGTEDISGTQRNVVKDTWFDGPVPKIISDFRAFMKTTIREFDYLGQEGKFIREPEYPEFALDEAVVNALVHRSYSLGNVAVFVRMFDNRIEVESPGIFPSNARPDAEGVFPFSAPRNPKLAETLQYLEIVRLAKEGTRRMHDEMERLGLPPPKFSEVQSAKVVVTLFNDIERRRNRLGAAEASRQWDEVQRYLGSDLAIERRQAISIWEDLARRNAWAPEQIWRTAIHQVRSTRASSQDQGRLLRLLAAQPPETLAPIAKSLLEALTSGQLASGAEVSGQVSNILARVDETIEQLISWIENYQPILNGDSSGDQLNIAFQALWARLHRDRLPPRDWLDRVAGLAQKYRSNSAARSLYGEITGKDI